MIYRDFQGLKLSALGFGVMRLPVMEPLRGGKLANVDSQYEV